MNLILTEIQTLTATEEVPCEAMEMFWKIPQPINYKGATTLDFVLLFKSRFGKAKEGEKYLNLFFVDEDSELFEMKALPSMNRFMFRMNFYPDFIQNALENYKNNYRLNKNI